MGFADKLQAAHARVGGWGSLECQGTFSYLIPLRFSAGADSGASTAMGENADWGPHAWAGVAREERIFQPQMNADERRWYAAD
jgi:hypothetical protein